MSKMISNIVFTKNRPLQLHAYLESLYRHFPAELIQTYVIYKAELFGEEYDRLFRRFSDCIVIREQDFHSDFLQVLDMVETKYILFGIDDVVYFDSVDFDVIDKTFSKHEQDIFGFTLRFGTGMLKDSGDEIIDVTIDGQKVHRLNWKNGRTSHSRYPFELCATIYRTDVVEKIVRRTMNNNPVIKRLFRPNSFLIRSMGKIASPRSTLKAFGYFFSPNTLESWNCRWCRRHKDEFADCIYFQNHCAAAIQVNMVNTSTKDTFTGIPEFTVEALNEKYKRGYALDIDSIAADKPTATHCGHERFKLVKNRRISESWTQKYYVKIL
jgi:hypothetical protein